MEIYKYQYGQDKPRFFVCLKIDSLRNNIKRGLLFELTDEFGLQRPFDNEVDSTYFKQIYPEVFDEDNKK